jgi:hypothetical protein
MASVVSPGAKVRCKAGWTRCVQECGRREEQKEHSVCFRETSKS